MIAGRWATRVLGVLALGAVVASCGGSNFQYVQNSSENTYFKLPSNWKLFRLTEPDKEGRPPKLPVDTQRIWHVAFDAANQPDQKGQSNIARLGGPRRIRGDHGGVHDTDVRRLETFGCLPL